MTPIYLDHNASTPLLARAAEEMYLASRSIFGNPSSIHAEGRKAAMALRTATEAVASLLGCAPNELLFTSGGTEANNLGILGVLRARSGPRHFITSAVEHKSVLEAAEAARREGVAVTILPVDREGRVAPEQLRLALRPDTTLVSIMSANNEVGTLQDIATLGALVREHGALFHSDMVQSLGKVPVDLSQLPVDLASFSAHKIGGPKGVGALLYRGSVTLQPLVFGGKQGRGLRPGTENLLGIIGFGCAATECRGSLADSIAAMRARRHQLLTGLTAGSNSALIHGPAEACLPNTVSVSFPGCDVETLLLALDSAGVAVSVGSACNAGSATPSHVLRAMGLSKECLDCTLRLSLGSSTTAEEIEHTLRALAEAVEMSRLSLVA